MNQRNGAGSPKKSNSDISSYDLDGQGYYYNDTGERLSWVTIDNIISEIDMCTGLFEEIYGVASKLSEDIIVLDELNQCYENLGNLGNIFKEVTWNEEVYKLASFDSSERANRIIQEEYSSVAYDEYLEKYVQKSMGIVFAEFQE